MNKKLIQQMKAWYLGDLEISEFRNAVAKHLRKLGELPQHIEFLKNHKETRVGDIVAIAHETPKCLFYYDGAEQYVHIEKSERGSTFEYVENWS